MVWKEKGLQEKLYSLGEIKKLKVSEKTNALLTFPVPEIAKETGNDFQPAGRVHDGNTGGERLADIQEYK